MLVAVMFVRLLTVQQGCIVSLIEAPTDTVLAAGRLCERCN
jgi:hypothetical protein